MLKILILYFIKSEETMTTIYNINLLISFRSNLFSLLYSNTANRCLFLFGCNLMATCINVISQIISGVKNLLKNKKVQIFKAYSFVY